MATAVPPTSTELHACRRFTLFPTCPHATHCSIKRYVAESRVGVTLRRKSRKFHRSGFRRISAVPRYRLWCESYMSGHVFQPFSWDRLR